MATKSIISFSYATMTDLDFLRTLIENWNTLDKECMENLNCLLSEEECIENFLDEWDENSDDKLSPIIYIEHIQMGKIIPITKTQCENLLDENFNWILDIDKENLIRKKIAEGEEIPIVSRLLGSGNLLLTSYRLWNPVENEDDLWIDEQQDDNEVEL